MHDYISKQSHHLVRATSRGIFFSVITMKQKTRNCLVKKRSVGNELSWLHCLVVANVVSNVSRQIREYDTYCMLKSRVSVVHICHFTKRDIVISIQQT